jgi:hypothetical protein
MPLSGFYASGVIGTGCVIGPMVPRSGWDGAVSRTVEVRINVPKTDLDQSADGL